MGEQTSKPPQTPKSFRKGSSDPMCLRFSCLWELQSPGMLSTNWSCSPCSYKPTCPPLASNFLSGKAEPSPGSAGRPGLSKQVLAGCTPEERWVSVYDRRSQPWHRRCVAATASPSPALPFSILCFRTGRYTDDLSIKLHTSDWRSGIIFFLVNLRNRQWKMNWFNGHDCTGCLFQNNFPKHAKKSELQHNFRRLTCSSKNPRSKQTDRVRMSSDKIFHSTSGFCSSTSDLMS